jgi:DNA (cytosine-5)-methyltransferase 1
LESLGYEVGAADLCAAGVGAPHIRQRLYWMAHRKSKRRDRSAGMQGANRRAEPETNCPADGLGHADSAGPQGRDQRIFRCEHQWPVGTPNQVVLCEDGKARRFEPGSFPLAHGIPGRVGLLRGYGNTIVPQLAAEFIQAACEAINS